MLSNHTANRRMRPILKLEMPKHKDEKYHLRSIQQSPVHKKKLNLYPNVTSISVLDKLFPYLYQTIDFAHEKALLVFDIDDVLIYSRQIGAINSKGFLTPNAINSINELTKHVDVIGLTARDETSIADLKSYGLNFLEPHNKITLTKEQEQNLKNFGYSYHDNIIYTNMLEKGTALDIIYSYSKIPYDKVIFLDDNKNNCLAVLYRMHDNNRPISSCHLTNIELTTEKTEKCILNMNGYPIKEKPYFHLDKPHS
jgi:hypothetical protein